MAAIAYDLLALFVFKYIDFFITNINKITGSDIKLLELTLPLGISFYTFQIMSYVIDLYKGKIKVEKSPVILGTYLSMFPQLIAGPIVVYSDVSSKLHARHISLEDIEDGIATFKIDLSNAEITPNLDSHIVEVNITNDVEIAINPNTNSLDTVDYYQEHGWTDSTEEGEEAFRNSYNKVVDKVKEKLSQNDAIMNEAKKSAKTQVSNLVKAICGGETNIRLFINGVEVQD